MYAASEKPYSAWSMRSWRTLAALLSLSVALPRMCAISVRSESMSCWLVVSVLPPGSDAQSGRVFWVTTKVPSPVSTTVTCFLPQRSMASFN